MELYIHIPFCVKKCRYCDFTSFAGMADRIDAYLMALLAEAAQQRSCVDEPIETVYLGGGTPSLLSPAQLERLIRGLTRLYRIDDNAEFTAEANPGTVTDAWLETARALGINRLSLGVQAAQDHLLRQLGRIHRFPDAEIAAARARKAGFRQLNLDLIFGIPGQSEADWKDTLSRTLELQPEHISAYGLIPEEGTPLMADLRAGRLQMPPPEAERAMYEMLKDTLRKSGYAQYEISNFAQPGAACRHNIGYWTQKPYLGLGLSAASMVHPHKEGEGLAYTRMQNPNTFALYDRLVHAGEENLRETEEISPKEARFETMMLGLRMTRGISEADFESMHGISVMRCYGKKLLGFQAQGLMDQKEGRWFLTDRGMDIQNAILVELMEDENEGDGAKKA